jgi:hypothetical protein
VVHACNLSTWEAEIGEFQVLGQLGLDSKTLPQKSKKEPSMMAQTCNPGYWGGGDQENHGLRTAWAKNICKIPSQTMNGHRLQPLSGHSTMVQAYLSIKGDLISKITDVKRAERVANVVEHLPNKQKALNLTPSITRKKKITKEKMSCVVKGNSL